MSVPCMILHNSIVLYNILSNRCGFNSKNFASMTYKFGIQLVNNNLICKVYIILLNLYYIILKCILYRFD